MENVRQKLLDIEGSQQIRLLGIRRALNHALLTGGARKKRRRRKENSRKSYISYWGSKRRVASAISQYILPAFNAKRKTLSSLLWHGVHVHLFDAYGPQRRRYTLHTVGPQRRHDCTVKGIEKRMASVLPARFAENVECMESEPINECDQNLLRNSPRLRRHVAERFETASIPRNGYRHGGLRPSNNSHAERDAWLSRLAQGQYFGEIFRRGNVSRFGDLLGPALCVRRIRKRSMLEKESVRRIPVSNTRVVETSIKQPRVFVRSSAPS